MKLIDTNFVGYLHCLLFLLYWPFRYVRVVYKVFKHSSSDLNLTLLLLVAKFTSSFVMKHSHFLARPGPVFHLSFLLPDMDMFSKFFNSSLKTLYSFAICSLANAASVQISSLLGLYLRFLFLRSPFLRPLLCFPASFFKVQHCLVECVGLCPCNMQKCCLPLLSLLF